MHADNGLVRIKPLFKLSHWSREKNTRDIDFKGAPICACVICLRLHLSVLLGDGSLHLHDNRRLHLAGSHRALLLLVRHRLQHQRVGLLEAPTLEDPGDGEEGADKGEASHG